MSSCLAGDFVDTFDAEKPECAICHKKISEFVSGQSVARRIYAECWSDGKYKKDYMGKRIDFEFESFWVCNDCLEEEKHE